VAVALATPVVGFGLLLTAPPIDRHWDHQPSHFWLVLGAAAVATVLGWSVGTSARKRSDARLFLVSLSFIASALFLGLHALATPRVLLAGSTAGFVVAVPVGLLIAGSLAVWSAMPLDGGPARWIMTHSSGLQLALLAVAAAWCVGSLAELAPLNDRTPVESGSAFMIILGLPAAVAFGVAAWRYLVLAYQRRATLLIAVAAAWVLLAEAAVAVSVTENWRVSWWMWHILMLSAFGAIATAAARMPETERFSDLYLDEVVGGTREVSVLFADLKGFTRFSEQHPPETVREMLNTYLAAVLPSVRAAGGRLDRLIGDAVMVTFNVAVDQPDHAARAACAALGLRDTAARVAASHPLWPRLRVGVNTGTAVVGVLGDDTQRDYTVLGDTVNVAAHIERLAPVDAIAISDATRRAVAGARVVSLGAVSLKTRTAPIEIWRLDGLDNLED
jgi:adenylate cyclase